jgi:hypothetical protein
VTVLAEKTWVRRSSALIAIKVVHTVIWAFFVSFIFAIQLAEPGAPKKRQGRVGHNTGMLIIAISRW